MKNYCLSILFIFSLISSSFSQKETEKWYYAGSPAPAIDFSSGSPVALNNSGITFSWESGSSLADANGNLLFYADGNSVCFNSTHVAMTNGTGIIMHNSVTQGCIFIPKPGSPTIYYLFHIGKPSLGSTPFDLYYSEIDMTLSSGLGAITANKNVSIVSSFNNCSEKMTATKHCNGTDYWLMVHDYTGTTFKAYLITAAGVSTTPVVTTIGSSFTTGGSSEDAVGQMKFSPNGIKLATILPGSDIVECFDFNKSTGVLSNNLNLGSCGSQFGYGLEFSPDNSKIYVSGSGTPGVIKQWDLCAGSNASIIASGTTVANNISAYSLQMAPDGKIYGAKFSTNLLGINNPNVAGIGCGYIANAINTAPGTSQLGLPNFITSYFDSPPNTALASISSSNISCSCNDSATATIIGNCAGGPFTYTWSTGAIVGPTTATSNTISNLCPGSYNVIINDVSCKKDTIVFTITGGTMPVATISPDVTISIGSSATLNAGGGVNYNWYPASGLNTTTGTTVIATPVQTTTYCVQVSDSSNTCFDTACVTVRVGCSNFSDIEIPNVFTPNNDRNNDVFQLKDWDLCIETFEMKIYDRWGIKIFESTSSNVEWDGRILSGTEATDGTYYYIFNIKNKNGAEEKLSGFVSLIR